MHGDRAQFLPGYTPHFCASAAIPNIQFVDPNLGNANTSDEAAEMQLALVQFYEAVYYLVAVSLAMMSIWIIWMPLVPFLVHNVATGEVTTTISDTFSRYNTVSTIYMVGPVSILFLFRMVRTFSAPLHFVPAVRKRYISLALIAVQYFLLVIIRYDTIQGFMHPLSVAVVFGCLFVYHALVYNKNTNRSLKTIVRRISSCFIICFAILVWLIFHLQTNHWLYIVACIVEVFAVLSLGFLDFIDLAEYRGNYSEEMQKMIGSNERSFNELVPMLSVETLRDT